MGQVCTLQFFFHAQDLVEIWLPSECFSDRLKAGGTACTQRVTGQGRASFLPRELLWHIPMPCVLLPSCQSQSFSECGCRGNAPLTLCVSGHKISFCRLLSTQRSAANKQGRSEDFSQQRLQVLCVMEASSSAASTSHSHS